jgi:CheY-like chemotaxis protein
MTQTILLVDDEPSLLKLMALSLARHARKIGQEWQIRKADDAASAMAAVKDLSCGLNVLVTDIQMPEVTGEELIRQVRQACPLIDVLAISGALPEGSPGLANVQVLRKPFAMALLAESVQDLLAVQL